MSANRGHARKIERQKRRRAEIRKKQSAAVAATRPSALLKRASDFPIERTWLSRSWRDDNEQMPALVTAIVTRRAPGGVLIASALVDRTCLGVRDAAGWLMNPLQLEDYLQRAFENNEMELVDPELCLSVVYHAIDFARGLGFSPHEDFPSAMFEPRPATLIDTPLAKPTKPFYIAGQRDDAAQVLSKLHAAVDANFRYLIPDSDGNAQPVDASELMGMLGQLRMARTARQLFDEGKLDEAEPLCKQLVDGEGPGSLEAMELMARICEARGHMREAMQWLQRALSEGSEDMTPDDLQSLRTHLSRISSERRQAEL